ncbi:ribokinase [Pontibacter pamirensis]|uniref:ribokinase n=1 Tax=Pontibacter pamirensis TaxID=2562824 RepID=UPI00138A0D3C|nr:ribokinase [Pontibacter pamirensis]
MKQALIISLGSINKDIQVRTERWPEPGETLLAEDYMTLGGGKAANRAYLVRQLGAPSLLLARTGDDQEAKEALQPLKETGVNLEHVKQLQGQRTGLSMVVVRADGKKTIILSANANQNWEQEGPDLVEQVISEAPKGSVLAIDLEIPAAVAGKAMQTAKKKNIQVVLDPSPTHALKAEYFELADFLTPNKSEAESIVGFEIKNKDDGFHACEAIQEKGARNVIIKLGKDGYVMLSDNEQHFVPAPDVQVTDTTGAGDAFAGALAFAIWEKQDAISALRFAVTASSLATETYGSQPAYPDRATIENKMAAFNL